MLEFHVSGSRQATDDVGACRVRAKSVRHSIYPRMPGWTRGSPSSPSPPKASLDQDERYNGIHGTEAERGFGQPAGQGGIRLRNEEAQELWEWAEEGTPVFIYRFRQQRRSLPTPVLGQDPSRYGRTS